MLPPNPPQDGRDTYGVVDPAGKKPGVGDIVTGLFGSTGGTIGSIGGALTGFWGGYKLGEAIGGPILGFLFGLAGAVLGLFVGGGIGNGISTALNDRAGKQKEGGGNSPVVLKQMQPELAKKMTKILNDQGVQNADKRGNEIAEELVRFTASTVERANKGDTFTIGRVISAPVTADKKEHIFVLDKKGRALTVPDADKTDPVAEITTGAKLAIEAAFYGKALIVGEFHNGVFEGHIQKVTGSPATLSDPMKITLPLNNERKLDFSNPAVKKALAEKGVTVAAAQTPRPQTQLDGSQTVTPPNHIPRTPPGGIGGQGRGGNPARPRPSNPAPVPQPQ